jgi:hypothetical protein
MTALITCIDIFEKNLEGFWRSVHKLDLLLAGLFHAAEKESAEVFRPGRQDHLVTSGQCVTDGSTCYR